MYDIPSVYAIDDDEIYKYVYVCTVKRLRMEHKMGVGDADYFLKSQDFNTEFLKSLSIHNAIKINDTVSIIPIDFDVKNNFPVLIVFMQKEDGSWRITKVEYERGY